MLAKFYRTAPKVSAVWRAATESERPTAFLRERQVRQGRDTTIGAASLMRMTSGAKIVILFCDGVERR
jgi:hypothetical protein